jgi:hypothetical protein
VKAISLASQLRDDSRAKIALFPERAWTTQDQLLASQEFNQRVTNWLLKFQNADKKHDSLRKKEAPEKPYAPESFEKVLAEQKRAMKPAEISINGGEVKLVRQTMEEAESSLMALLQPETREKYGFKEPGKASITLNKT